MNYCHGGCRPHFVLVPLGSDLPTAAGCPLAPTSTALMRPYQGSLDEGRDPGPYTSTYALLGLWS